MLPLVVALLLSASTAPACAFRVVPGGGVTSGVRALHAAASPNVPQLSRRALAPLALGAAVTLREPKETSAAFPNIASIKQADIDGWTELDGTCMLGDGCDVAVRAFNPKPETRHPNP